MKITKIPKLANSTHPQKTQQDLYLALQKIHGASQTLSSILHEGYRSDSEYSKEELSLISQAYQELNSVYGKPTKAFNPKRR